MNQKGFTLVELMAVSLILPMIVGSMFAVLSMANVIFHTNDIYSRLNQSAMQSLRYISREIGQTSPNATPSHLNIAAGANSVVRFQIPVDWDNDGDVVNGSMNPNVEWGAYAEAGQTSNGSLGGWVQYSVNNSNQLIRDVLDAGLAPVAGQTRIVATNVLNFTVTQAQSTVTMTLTLRGTDTLGQFGQTRNIQSTFTSATLLRNAVS